MTANDLDDVDALALRPPRATGGLRPASANVGRFDLVSIRLAVLCAELGSLSAAAKNLHCSISTCSYRLSALEESLGKQLFTRDHRGLQTNAAGELFVRHAKAILDHVQLMDTQVRSSPLNPAKAVANPDQGANGRFLP